MSVSLLVSSSEMEARLNRTMVAAATSATETRNRSIPSASLGLPIRPPSPGCPHRRAPLSGFSEVNGDKFHPRWVRPAAEAMVARLAALELVTCSSSRRTSAIGVCSIRSGRLSAGAGGARSGAISIRISLIPRYRNLGQLELSVADDMSGFGSRRSVRFLEGFQTGGSGCDPRYGWRGISKGWSDIVRGD